jgi:hypothetical protein
MTVPEIELATDMAILSWLSIGPPNAMVKPGEILPEVVAKTNDSLRDILLDRGQP